MVAPDGAGRPLSALLSQSLVAFTVEFDNEFERRMAEADYSGAHLSLMLWANLVRFIGPDGVSVRDLARQALAPETQMKFGLGCMERWSYIFLRPAAGDDRPVPVRAHPRAKRELRDGWGSGRGIRADWIVSLTPQGRQASEIWPPLFSLILRRWERRFGDDDIAGLRQSLRHVAGQLDLELPHGLPVGLEPGQTFPPKAAPGADGLSLPALLSQLLLAFRMEFDREAPAPLPLSANTLRVLSQTPLRESEISRLTGASPETAGLGWQIKPFVLVGRDPSAARGKVVRLSPRGVQAQQAYHRLTRQIETRWEARYGKDHIRALREALHGLFERYSGDGDRPLLAEGLLPPPGTVRAGDRAPALGRRDIGSAQRQRMRRLIAQTEEFVSDPAGTLPHYPLWDMNRGFGP